MRRLAPWLPGLLLIVIGACGGSGGTPAAPADALPAPFPLSGSFHVVAEAQARTAYFGSGVADAGGAYTGTLIHNTLGIVTSPPMAYEAAYATLPDGTLAWSSAATGETGLGGLTPDGRVAAWWWAAGFTNAGGLSILLRREGVFDEGSVEGTYRYVTLTASPLSGAVSSAGGTLVFDGLGGVTVTLEFINEEGVRLPGGTTTASYAVSEQGDIEIDTGTAILKGGVGRGGEVLILGGGRDEMSPPFVMHAVRQGTGHGPALLAGDYTAALRRIEPLTHEDLGKLALLEADGAGGATWTALYPDLANGRPRLPAPTSYTVTPDGQLDVVLEGLHYQGALSASGDVAILGGGSEDGEDPALLVLLHKRVLPPTDAIGLDLFQSASIGRLRGTHIAGTPDTLDVVLTHRSLRVGETRPLGLGAPHGLRAVLRFDLGVLRPGASVARATLVTRQDEVRGTPFSVLGALQVDHVDVGAVLTRSDFDPPRRPIGTIGALSTGTAPGTRTLDVTAAVQADVADDRATSDFLLLFPVEQNADEEIDLVVFDEHAAPGPSPGPRTRLVLTYE